MRFFAPSILTCDLLLQCVEAAVSKVSREDVPYQAGCSAPELRTAVTEAFKAPAKKLTAVHARIQKHLGHSSSQLATTVWTQVQVASSYAPAATGGVARFVPLAWWLAASEGLYFSWHVSPSGGNHC